MSFQLPPYTAAAEPVPPPVKAEPASQPAAPEPVPPPEEAEPASQSAAPEPKMQLALQPMQAYTKARDGEVVEFTPK
eukprot:1571300-Karenia_brevis.AAC.1